MSDNHTKAKNHKKKKKKTSRRRFRLGFRIYLISLAVVLVGLLVVLWVKISDYQSGIDEETALTEQETASERAPQLAFENYLSSMTVDDWVSAWKTSNPYTLDTDDTIREYMQTHITEAEAYRAPEYTDDSPVYLLRTDGCDLARFYMTGSGTEYTVSSVDVYGNGEYSVNITIPSGCELICNGITVSDRYVLAESSTASVPEYEDQITGPTASVMYSLDNLLAEPEISVSCGIEGKNIAQDSLGNYQLTLDSSDAQSYKDKAEGFLRALLYYYDQGKSSPDEHMASVLSYVASGSNAYDVIQGSYSGVLWRQPVSASYDITSSDVFVLADNCYCVDVSYAKTGDSADTSDNTSSAASETYRVYFLDLGSGYKLYSFELF